MMKDVMTMYCRNRATSIPADKNLSIKNIQYFINTNTVIIYLETF